MVPQRPQRRVHRDRRAPHGRRSGPTARDHCDPRAAPVTARYSAGRWFHDQRLLPVLRTEPRARRGPRPARAPRGRCPQPAPSDRGPPPGRSPSVRHSPQTSPRSRRHRPRLRSRQGMCSQCHGVRATPGVRGVCRDWWCRARAWVHRRPAGCRGTSIGRGWTSSMMPSNALGMICPLASAAGSGPSDATILATSGWGAFRPPGPGTLS